MVKKKKEIIDKKEITQKLKEMDIIDPISMMDHFEAMFNSNQTVSITMQEDDLLELLEVNNQDFFNMFINNIIIGRKDKIIKLINLDYIEEDKKQEYINYLNKLEEIVL